MSKCKKTIIISEKQADNIKSAMMQVHNKVNAGCLDNIMVCENKIKPETMYRGYKREFGSQRDYLLWLTDDPSYAKEYGDTIDEFLVDIEKVGYSIYTIDEYDYSFDYYDGPSEQACIEALKNGVGGYQFYVNDDTTFCVCMWDKSAILSQRTLSQEEFDNIKSYELDEETIPSKYEIGYDIPGDSNSYAHVVTEAKNINMNVELRKGGRYAVKMTERQFEEVLKAAWEEYWINRKPTEYYQINK